MAYALAAIAPERLETITALSLGYSPRGAFPVPPFEQSRAWWYQWFMSVDRGAEAVAKDPKGFARIQWETWSPRGWFDEATFEAVAQSFENPDWLAITLNSYRGRWRDEEPRDPRYDTLHQKIAATETLGVPTLMIQGAADGTVLPSSTEGKDKYFTSRYRRLVLDGIGHFPTREAPAAVADAVLKHLT
jgi:pimeloyl-ACP methyl ester carboxylesterase